MVLYSRDSVSSKKVQRIIFRVEPSILSKISWKILDERYGSDCLCYSGGKALSKVLKL